MQWLEAVAEARIAEAMERGELDGLPGSGRPLELDDDRLVPEELRVGYRILKNAGCLPPEVELRREIHSLRELLGAVARGEERAAAFRRLQALELRLSLARGREVNLRVEHSYFERICDRLASAGGRGS